MSKLLGQFLETDTVNDEKILLQNNAPLRARNAADTADVNLFKLNTSNILELPTQTQITFTPSAPDDVASKDYVDTQVATVSFTAGDALDTDLSFVTNVLVDNVTLKINGSNQLEGLKPSSVVFTLSGGDISNGYIDLSHEAYSSSVAVIAQGIPQTPLTDFTLSVIGGVTRVTFSGDLSANAQASDLLLVFYSYL